LHFGKKGPGEKPFPLSLATSCPHCFPLSLFADLNTTRKKDNILLAPNVRRTLGRSRFTISLSLSLSFFSCYFLLAVRLLNSGQIKNPSLVGLVGYEDQKENGKRGGAPPPPSRF
jgi:hypothetical protein